MSVAGTSVRLFAALSLAGLLAVPAIAGQEAHSTVRLIAGERVGEEYRAGVEIALDKGWKTYWRMPGESGVPPDFDWSRSENVGGVEVRYPAPHRFTDAGGEAIGYKSAVVFPVTVRPKDASRPVELKLTLHYAVCMDICVPAKAEVARRLDALSAKDAALVREAEALVPVRESPRLNLINARVETSGDLSLIVTLEGEAASAAVDIFVEGFDDAYFRAPERRGAGVFALKIDGLSEAAALKGRTLTLTIVAGDAQLVREARVE